MTEVEQITAWLAGQGRIGLAYANLIKRGRHSEWFAQAGVTRMGGDAGSGGEAASTRSASADAPNSSHRPPNKETL